MLYLMRIKKAGDGQDFVLFLYLKWHLSKGRYIMGSWYTGGRLGLRIYLWGQLGQDQLTEEKGREKRARAWNLENAIGQNKTKEAKDQFKEDK